MALGPVGTGSGMDVQSTVQGLVQSRRAPEQQNINQRRTEIISEISAFGRVETAVDGFRGAIRELGKSDNYKKHSVLNTDKELFTAEASTKAAPGDFSISVLQLASSDKLISGAVTDRENIGSGKLIFALGQGENTASFTVDLLENPYSDNSLDDLAQMINSHADNKGIVAGIIQDKQGAHLVLSSSKTGEDSKISVQAEQLNSSLGKFDTDTPFMRTLSEGQDAIISIDGLQATSGSNTFKDTIKGVDFTVLKKSEINEDGTLSGADLKIENDHSNIQELVQSFVDNYNQFIDTVNSETRHDDMSDSDGALAGSSVLSSAARQVRTALNEHSQAANSVIKSLSELGVTTTRQGGLVLDTQILNSQIENNYQAVEDFFTGREGFAKRLADKVDIFGQTGGSIDNANNSLIEEQRALDTKQASLDRKMASYEQRLEKQYSTMDNSVNDLTSQLGYIQGVLG